MKPRLSLAGSILSVALAGITMLGAAQQASAQDWKKTYDGVEYCYLDKELHAVRIETGLIGVSIFPLISKKGEPSPPYKWAEKHKLQVAVNANFFSMKTMQDPSGMAIYQGVNWGKGNTKKHAQFGFTKDNRLKYYTANHTDQPSWYYYAVAGEPEIIENGKVRSDINSSEACKSLGHCQNKRSRTGICTDKEGKYLIFATTKGDNSNGGITVVNFAKLMLKLGCDYGVNLDGGGSAGIYLNGKKYGTNSGRTVAVNLGFWVKEKPAYVCKKAEVDNPGSVFFDMPEDHWAASAVSALKEHSVTQGCGGEADRPLYCPSCGMQRFEAAKFVSASLGLTASSPETPTFSDVAADADGFGSIEALVEKGIIPKETEFRPAAVITRAEAATLLAKSFVENADAYKDAPTPTFLDVAADHLAYPYVEALVRNCMLSGMDGKFEPDKTMDRAEFGSWLARAAGYITGDCAFTKQCENPGEKSCSDNKVSTCVAYENVLSDCPEEMNCYNGVCAQCDSAAAAVCEEQNVKACVDGSWQLTDCSADGRICEAGACVEPPECDETFEPKCDDQNRIQSCISGKFNYEPCPEGQICESAECHENKPVEEPPVEPKPEKPTKPTDEQKENVDKIDSTEPIESEVRTSSDCSKQTSHPTFPWLLALLGTAGLMLRRRRSEN